MASPPTWSKAVRTVSLAKYHLANSVYLRAVTLAENAASVLMSQFAEIGEVVYACALGVDNQ